MLLKGDIVTLKCGRTGEVLDIWGYASTFARIRLDNTTQTLPVMASDIMSYIRPVKTSTRGGEPREKRKKANQTTEASISLCEPQPEQLACL